MNSVFPAYAGVILKKLQQLASSLRVSRIRGGDPYIGCCNYLQILCFPHTRG